jgi:hypothetical protein
MQTVVFLCHATTSSLYGVPPRNCPSDPERISQPDAVSVVEIHVPSYDENAPEL